MSGAGTASEVLLDMASQPRLEETQLTLHLYSLIRLNPAAVRSDAVLLWGCRLDLECDRLRVAVRDSERALDKLSKGA